MVMTRVPIRKRLWRKVRADDDGCWTWTGGTTGTYGHFYLDGKMTLVHRWLWERTYGPVPDGLELDHLCRNQRCIRPDHLEAVTHSENIRRGLKGVLLTHCPQGHEYTPSNTIFHHVIRRRCRTCKAAMDAEYRVRVRNLPENKEKERTYRQAYRQRPEVMERNRIYLREHRRSRAKVPA